LPARFGDFSFHTVLSILVDFVLLVDIEICFAIAFLEFDTKPCLEQFCGNNSVVSKTITPRRIRQDFEPVGDSRVSVTRLLNQQAEHHENQ
jgi:hypothetical protein